METIVTTVERGIGRIVLNRPQALNAMDTPMYYALGRTLDGWRDDAAVRAVTIRGAGKAFCAGGDIKYTLASVRAGDGSAEAGYREEYRVDALIHDYPKPVAAIVHGICMGGGMGLAMHAARRFVTAGALLAMPETAIGFFPDCGIAWLLARLPGAVGTYLGLTGARVGAGDALALGLATDLASAEQAEAVEDVLRPGGTSTGETLAPGDIAEHRAEIDAAFGAPDVPGIVAALASSGTEWAAATLATLRALCPMSLLVTFELLRRVRDVSLDRAFALDLALATRMAHRPDFAEGVRAIVVDKDRNPKWNPARLEDFDPSVAPALLDEVAAAAH